MLVPKAARSVESNSIGLKQSSWPSYCFPAVCAALWAPRVDPHWGPKELATKVWHTAVRAGTKREESQGMTKLPQTDLLTFLGWSFIILFSLGKQKPPPFPCKKSLKIQFQAPNLSDPGINSDLDPDNIFSLLIFSSKEDVWQYTPKANIQENPFVPFKLDLTHLREAHMAFQSSPKPKCERLEIIYGN